MIAAVPRRKVDGRDRRAARVLATTLAAARDSPMSGRSTASPATLVSISGIAITAAERHRRVERAAHVEHDVGDRKAQRLDAARGGGTSLTRACAGPLIVLSVAAPRLMRPFILPSNVNPGTRDRDRSE